MKFINVLALFFVFVVAQLVCADPFFNYNKSQYMDTENIIFVSYFESFVEDRGLLAEANERVFLIYEGFKGARRKIGIRIVDLPENRELISKMKQLSDLSEESKTLSINVHYTMGYHLRGVKKYLISLDVN